MDENRVTKFLTALGDKTRLRILFELKGDALNVGDIAARFSLSRPAISHHLKVLLDADILSSEKRGQEVFYWINKKVLIDELKDMVRTLEQHFEAVETE